MRKTVLIGIWFILILVYPALAQAAVGDLSPRGNHSIEEMPTFGDSFSPDLGLANFSEERLLARAEIFFPYARGSKNNVFNAGVAAKYANGKGLEPGQAFSYNQVVGPRNTRRGFIIGANIWDNPEVGGGVCRTSTVIYQAARKAGFEILERHPHSLPVNYAAPGMDATVNWGVKDLRFKNNSPDFVTLYTRLDEEVTGRKLWAEFRVKVPRKRIEAVAIREVPEANSWENPEGTRLTALLQNETSFLPGEQLAELLALPCNTEEKSGRLAFTMQLNDQKITFREGAKTFYVNEQENQLSAAPFRIEHSSGIKNLWLPVRDWARLTRTEVIWLDQKPPKLLLNFSDAFQAKREELNPGQS